MHECTFPIWVIFIAIAAVFSVFVGIFDLRVPKNASGEVIINENNEIVAKDRIGPYKIFMVHFIFVILSACSFLWQYFATAKSSFSGFLPTIGSIGIIFLTVVAMIFAWIILFLIYVFFAFIRESSLEAKYSLLHDADVRITFIEQ